MVAEGDPLVAVSSPWWLRVTRSAKVNNVPSTGGGWAKYAMGGYIMCRYTQMLAIAYTDVGNYLGLIVLKYA